MKTFNQGCGKNKYFGIIDDKNKAIAKGRGITVDKITRNIEEKTFKVTMSTHFGSTQTLEIERGDIIKKNIKKLRDAGFDVTDKNFACFDEVLQFEENRYMEQNKGYKHNHSCVGWQPMYVGGKSVYMYKAYNSIGQYPSEYTGYTDIKPKGSLEAEINMYKTEVLGNIPLEAVMFISAAACVNGYIGHAVQTITPIFHICGDSSQGKTTAAKLAVSLYGSTEVTTDNLCRSWLSTPNMVTAGMKGNKGMVVSFDELSMFNKDTDLSTLVYSLSSGVDKARLTKEGVPRRMKPYERWQTVIISTGEASLLSKCNNNTGLKVRVFEITDAMTSSAQNADNILDVITKNYGHVAPLLADTMVKAGGQAVIEMFNKYKQLLVNSCNDNKFAERVCGAYALALTGGKLLSETIGVEFHFDDVFDYFVKLIDSSSEERDMAEVAFSQICEEISKNSDKFIYMVGNSWAGALGKIVDYDDHPKYSRQVIFYLSEFYKMLERLGYEDGKEVIKQLNAKGYLDCEVGKLYNRRKVGSHDAARVKVIIFNIPHPDKEGWTQAEKDEYKHKRVAMHCMGINAKAADNVSPQDESYYEDETVQTNNDNYEGDNANTFDGMPIKECPMDEFDMANCDKRLSKPKQPYKKNMATQMKYNRDNKDILLKQDTPPVTPGKPYTDDDSKCA